MLGAMINLWLCILSRTKESSPSTARTGNDIGTWPVVLLRGQLGAKDQKGCPEAALRQV